MLRKEITHQNPVMVGIVQPLCWMSYLAAAGLDRLSSLVYHILLERCFGKQSLNLTFCLGDISAGTNVQSLCYQSQT